MTVDSELIVHGSAKFDISALCLHDEINKTAERRGGTDFIWNNGVLQTYD